jgi:flagellar hook-basal body complex protein FliE
MPVNGINPNAAIGAYQTTQRIAGGGGDVIISAQGTNPASMSALDSVSESGPPSFADFLGGKIDQSVVTLKHGEELSAKAINGEANLTDVVQAVTNAEITLQTLVAVRDKMIGAYQEILRMQI